MKWRKGAYNFIYRVSNILADGTRTLEPPPKHKLSIKSIYCHTLTDGTAGQRNQIAKIIDQTTAGNMIHPVMQSTDIGPTENQWTVLLPSTHDSTDWEVYTYYQPIIIYPSEILHLQLLNGKNADATLWIIKYLQVPHDEPFPMPE